jgi:preprotein translocase subunit YajC
MGVIFYFLLYRPQKKEQKKRKEMLENLKRDAKIVTAGGIHGTIVSLSEETVVVRIAEKVEVKFSRSAISQILGKKNEEE